MGTFAGGLLTAGIGLLPGLFDRRSRGISRAQAAAQPFDVIGPFGRSVFSGGQLVGTLDPVLAEIMANSSRFARGQLNQLRALDIPGLEEKELKRLRELSRPEEQRLRAQVRNEQFQRGRLGLGVAGGRTGGFANPELAALAEGEATADLLRQGQAQRFARGEQARLLQNALTASGFAANLGTLPTGQGQLGINARLPQGLAGLPAGLAADQFDEISAFFAGLAPRIGAAVSNRRSRNPFSFENFRVGAPFG